jgi:hypothetical protein
MSVTLAVLVTRMAAKIAAYTYAFLFDHLSGSRKGRSRSWGLEFLATLNRRPR